VVNGKRPINNVSVTICLVKRYYENVLAAM
jgi:hypothetical protein